MNHVVSDVWCGGFAGRVVGRFGRQFPPLKENCQNRVVLLPFWERYRLRYCRSVKLSLALGYVDFAPQVSGLGVSGAAIPGI